MFSAPSKGSTTANISDTPFAVEVCTAEGTWLLTVISFCVEGCMLHVCLTIKMVFSTSGAFEPGGFQNGGWRSATQN